LQIVGQLNPLMYEFDQEKYEELQMADNIQYGLIAQEVEKILPELITKLRMTESTPYKSVNYNALIPILIEAIKQQQKEIDEFKRRLRNRLRIF